jgi:lysophospholipase L1-like esterase
MNARNALLQLVSIVGSIGCFGLTGCHLVHAGPDVAFLGDSITEGWSYPTVNYGVHGNTTAQMLGRFDRLIPGHGYHTVVLLGGTNDVLQGIDPNVTIHNLETLANDTIAQHAEPILCEIPPIFHSYDPAVTKDFGPQVIDLNNRIVKLAADHHWKLVDYYTPIVGHPSDSSDGVHMKRKGYLAMERALLHQLPL